MAIGCLSILDASPTGTISDRAAGSISAKDNAALIHWPTVSCSLQPWAPAPVQFKDDELKAAAGSHWSCTPNASVQLGNCVGHMLKGGESSSGFTWSLYVEYTATAGHGWIFKRAYSKGVGFTHLKPRSEC